MRLKLPLEVENEIFNEGSVHTHMHEVTVKAALEMAQNIHFGFHLELICRLDQ